MSIAQYTSVIDIEFNIIIDRYGILLLTVKCIYQSNNSPINSKRRGINFVSVAGGKRTTRHKTNYWAQIGLIGYASTVSFADSLSSSSKVETLK